MGEEHFARFRVDAGGIGLEAADAGEGVCNHHRQKGGNVPFATGGDALRIEAGQGQAAGIPHRGEEVEAPEREGVQAVSLHQDLQGVIDLDRTGIGIPDLPLHFLSVRCGFVLRLADFNQELLHGDLHHPDAEFVKDGHRIRVGGDEPVGRLSDDADALFPEAEPGFLHLFDGMDPLLQIGFTSVQDLSLEPLLTQVGKDFQRRGQRIALAGSQEVIPVDAPREHFRQQVLEDALRPAGADVDEVQRMGPEIPEIGALVLEIPVGKDPFEELIGNAGNGILVVETGGDGIYGYHNEKRESDLHRTATTSYPCCIPALGEFRGSWSCKTFPMQS